MLLSEIHLIGAKTQELLVGASSCPALAAAATDPVAEVVVVGHDTRDPGAAPYRMERPALDFGEVVGVLAGEGRAWLPGEGWRTMRAGDCYVCPRGAMQGFAPAPGRRLRLAWVHYAESTPGERVIPGEGCRLRPGDPEPLGEAIRRLHTEVLGANDAAMSAQLAGWVHLCASRLAHDGRGKAGDERLRRLWSRVDAELGEPWDMAALAAAASVSGEHLRRLCQREHGRSPMAEVTRLRMRRAGLLLRGTPLKVEAVAAAVGYGSLYAFSAAFRREIGVAPSVWRKGGEGSLAAGAISV